MRRGTAAPLDNDLETIVPEPTRLSKYPSAESWAYAFETGVREMPSSSASTRVEGTLCPARTFPPTISLR